MAKAKVLSFSFVGQDGKETRSPVPTSAAMLVRYRVDEEKLSEPERFEMPKASEAMLAWYGLKQKLSDDEAEAKGSMTPEQRITSMRECEARLIEGRFNQVREEAEAIVPTVDEAVVAAQVLGLLPTDEAIGQFAELCRTHGTEKLSPTILAQVRLTRRAAKQGTGTIGGDLTALFKK